ncbi:MAG TPA: HAD-IB family hydrolase [Planctomycetota bacterium]|nr:HAD-IB family hydrolase [Planctomycetota bacterium]
MRGTESDHAAAAYCDVDGTIAATNIVMPLLWFRRKRAALADKLWIASLPLRGPWWLLVDRFNRGASNRSIYRSYRGINAQWARENVRACFDECIKPRIFPQALERMEALKKEDVPIVLVTGGLDFILQPLAELLNAELIAPGLIEKNGVFTGEMNHAPLTGSAKYVAVIKHALRGHIDLAKSYAFGDAFGDANMLYAVGHPVAVSPDRRLRKIALRRGWEIAEWREEVGSRE